MKGTSTQLAITCCLPAKHLLQLIEQLDQRNVYRGKKTFDPTVAHQSCWLVKDVNFSLYA